MDCFWLVKLLCQGEHKNGEESITRKRNVVLLVGNEEGFSCAHRTWLVSAVGAPGCFGGRLTAVMPLSYCLCPWQWGAFSATIFPLKIASSPVLLDPVLGVQLQEIKALLWSSWPTQVNGFWAGSAE